MDKIYRIGSFNLHNIGTGAFTNDRDLEKIANEAKTKLDDVTKKLTETEAKVSTAENALAKANEALESLKKPIKKAGFGSKIKNAKIWNSKFWAWNWFKGKKV